MSNRAFSGTKGYGYQTDIAVLFAFVFYYQSNKGTTLIYEPKLSSDFDDFEIKFKGKTYRFQTKSYAKEDKVIIENNQVKYHETVSTFETGPDIVNVFVVDEKDRVKRNRKFFGLPCEFDKNNGVYVLRIERQTIEKIKDKFSINKDRKYELSHYFSNCIYLNKGISFDNVPKYSVFSSALDKKTFKIRSKQNFGKGITFVIGPAGIGKSHYVNEIFKKSEIILYRFFSTDNDVNVQKRLVFNSFLDDLNILSSDEERKKDENGIISSLSNCGKILILDGLDHVERYNLSELAKYKTFIENLHNAGINCIVLTRPLKDKFYSKYNVVSLKKWSKKETKTYCNHYGIKSCYQDDVYKIGTGYPILTYFLCSEIQKGNFLNFKNKSFKKVNEYYDYIFQTYGDTEAKYSLATIAKMPSFLHENDFSVLFNERERLLLLNLFNRMDYLFCVDHKRITCCHDSLNGYLSEEKLLLDKDIVGKIFDSLMRGEINFMSRASKIEFSNEQKLKLIEKYCDIDTYLGIISSNIDFESIIDFYEFLKQLCNEMSASILNCYQLYNFAIIFMLNSHNRFDDNTNLVIQIYNQLKLQKKDWGDLVFSSKYLYSKLVAINEKWLNEDAELVYGNLDNSDIESQCRNEGAFYHIQNHKGIKSKILKRFNSFSPFLQERYEPEMFVYHYFFDKSDDARKMMEEYTQSKNIYYTYKLYKKLFPLTRRDDCFGVRFVISRAYDRLMCLNEIKYFEHIGSLEEFFDKNKSLNTFEMYIYLNGYIRYCNHNNIVVNLCSLYKYLIMYEAHKEMNVVYFPEVLKFYFEKKIIKLSTCKDILNCLADLTDDGNRFLGENFINLMGPKNFKLLNKSGFFEKNSFRLDLASLSKKILNKMSYSEMIEPMIKSRIEKYSYDGDRKISHLRINNIFTTKHKKKILKKLEAYGFENDLDKIDDSSYERKEEKMYFNDGFYSEDEIHLYRKMNLQPSDVAKLTGFYSERLPNLDVFKIYPHRQIKKKVTELIKVAMFNTKRERLKDYNYTYYTLIERIPAFYKKYHIKTDSKIFYAAFLNFLNCLTLDSFK